VVAAGVVIAVRAVVSFSPSCLLGCGVSVVAFFYCACAAVISASTWSIVQAFGKKCF
jgi:hypothetical protein